MGENSNMVFFKEMQQKFIEEHHNEYVVIAEGSVFGFFKDYSSAFTAVIKRYPLGAFIIQKACEEGEDTFAFYSPVFR